ncbi:hypothetical protein KO481_33895 [Nocardia sp. NEAU-G5]|uniref:Uncharacterized protein n=1 Tax=Nocardia albiluteola TaxID=2842303 RepID=A0ABS6B883_9NOCA|nr:hypothetical protein [Nocardia albiluteola]MBU3066502.1 hypothetical protein [Nocardia albiluteola]
MHPQRALQDPSTYADLIAEFCASASEVDDLADPELVDRAADDLIDRISYTATVAEFHAAFVRVVTAAALPPGAAAAAQPHSGTTMLAFLRRVLAELERRRPWPEPALAQADIEDWPSTGSGLPIAWLRLPLPLVEQAVNASFEQVPGPDMPLLVLRLRTGQLVALIGAPGPAPDRFLVLLPDAENQQDPAEVIDHLVAYTGLPLETQGIGQHMTMLADL